MNGLFNSTTLDVVIGLIFVYLLLAIICTTVNEWLSGVFNLRSNTLAAAIRQLLDSQAGPGNQNVDWFLKQFWSHPLIAGMSKQANGESGPAPSYLAARTFASAVMDLVTPTCQGTISFPNLQDGVKALPDGDVKKALLALLQNAGSDLLTAQRNIENWFDDTMDRVGGWYKRKTQLWTVILAALLTVLANADTLRITHVLWANPSVRAQIVEQAKTTDGQKPSYDLSSLDDVIGWSGNNVNFGKGCGPMFLKLFGWLLTIIAVSLGAPFWFDILNKLMNIRNAGRKPPKAAKQSSLASAAQGQTS